jgi:hypothetical protein
MNQLAGPHFKEIVIMSHALKSKRREAKLLEAKLVALKNEQAIRSLIADNRQHKKNSSNATKEDLMEKYELTNEQAMTVMQSFDWLSVSLADQLPQVAEEYTVVCQDIKRLEEREEQRRANEAELKAVLAQQKAEEAAKAEAAKVEQPELPFDSKPESNPHTQATTEEPKKEDPEAEVVELPGGKPLEDAIWDHFKTKVAGGKENALKVKEVQDRFKGYTRGQVNNALAALAKDPVDVNDPSKGCKLKRVGTGAYYRDENLNPGETKFPLIVPEAVVNKLHEVKERINYWNTHDNEGNKLEHNYTPLDVNDCMVAASEVWADDMLNGLAPVPVKERFV